MEHMDGKGERVSRRYAVNFTIRIGPVCTHLQWLVLCVWAAVDWTKPG